EGSGELSYRSGDGFERARDDERLRPEVFQLSLFRRFDGRSFVRLGRFLPRELPAVGFIDGAHAEYAVDDRLRLGAIAGLKPTLDRLSPTADEPTGVVYASANLGDPRALRYFGTLGVLGSLFRGRPDRLAILLDQRLEAGAVGLFSSSEVDLDVDRQDTREGVRLTRWNLLGTWDVTPELRLSAGLDRFQVPDTASERAAFEPGALAEDELFRDDGYWRELGRASLRLPAALTLDGEVSFTESRGEHALRGLASLTRGGLPLLPGATATLAVYNLAAAGTDGVGGRLSAHLPLTGRLSLDPAVSSRRTRHETTGARFFDPAAASASALDASLRAQWIASRRWTLTGGAAFTRTDDDRRFLFDLGVTFTW
ncbi:MAG TPA: hypothetical protein VHF22_08040, partial [Planctomycetota bacterium]|nr:hypothetical protein [Planctomycetota bacterium]